MLCVASERPVDPVVIEILSKVDRVTRALALDYFVTGATARDILLGGVFGLDPGRGTKDVDLAIALDGWPQFDVVKTNLVETGAFAPDERVIHRLFHLGATGRKGYPVDLIPFGRVEAPEGRIAWPPERSIIIERGRVP